jgi:DNA-binding PadR family transcriptional regulator
MPTLYYHLEQLERKGCVIKEAEQDGNRPERQVYTITEEGREQFVKMIDEALAQDFEVEFLLDAVFYFGETIPVEKLISRLRNKKAYLERELSDISFHKNKYLERFTGAGDTMARAIYRHRKKHYQAEIEWLAETIHELKNLMNN